MVDKKILIVGILIALLLPFVIAVLGIPHQLYGQVRVGGQAVPNGVFISVKSGGDTYSTTTLNGKYGYEPIFLVEDEAGNKAGEIIEVYLNNIKVNELTFVNGGISQLDINIDGTCGDSICFNEDCNSCSIDCGSCPSQPPSGGISGGGGGGGGGASIIPPVTSSSSSSSCVENWQCTEWSDVSGACGKRTCTDKNNCGTTLLKPDEERKCEKRKTEEEQGFFSKITGAVIGGGAGSIISLIFILAILVAALIIYIRRKSK